MTDDHEPDEAEPASVARRWIDDTFDGCVYVHGVEGESARLVAGDEIPAGHEAQIRGHIPTTTVMPRSARIAAMDAGQAVPAAPDREAGFDPGTHTVREVNDYLDEHPSQVQIVLDRERSGKARHGILTGRD